MMGMNGEWKKEELRPGRGRDVSPGESPVPNLINVNLLLELKSFFLFSSNTFCRIGRRLELELDLSHDYSREDGS